MLVVKSAGQQLNEAFSLDLLQEGESGAKFFLQRISTQTFAATIGQC
jgi:hypothetical protein